MEVLVKIVKEFELYPEEEGDSIKYFKYRSDKITRVTIRMGMEEN